jgi:hypothetical protein
MIEPQSVHDNPWLGFSGHSLTPSVIQILGLHKTIRES